MSHTWTETPKTGFLVTWFNYERIVNHLTLDINQHVLIRRRDEINMQCDALLAEIENKRNFFLADLEYEERVHQNNFEESIKTLEKLLGSSQGLQNYVRDVIQFDRAPFLEVMHTLYTSIAMHIIFAFKIVIISHKA